MCQKMNCTRLHDRMSIRLAVSRRWKQSQLFTSIKLVEIILVRSSGGTKLVRLIEADDFVARVRLPRHNLSSSFYCYF
ncbi:Ribosomal protein uS12 methylthiotransferase RimO [Trichinella spiralis]|uniref:Ribosomal protein uS12 methylthiotransferase RimO n=1 Tax=Trichinella spiralis TaxID=6334 RepID=A0ABR3KLB7_TRISP